MGSTAILDLKAAYDSVLRRKLYRVIQESLDRETTDMVAFALQPVASETQGDTTRKRGTISKGVCQGSPLNTTIFNMYMDKLAQRVTAHMNHGNWPGTKEEEWNITLLADDVKARAKQDVFPQRILYQAAEWSQHSGMRRNISKCSTTRSEGALQP